MARLEALVEKRLIAKLFDERLPRLLDQLEAQLGVRALAERPHAPGVAVHSLGQIRPLEQHADLEAGGGSELGEAGAGREEPAEKTSASSSSRT